MTTASGRRQRNSTRSLVTRWASICVVNGWRRLRPWSNASASRPSSSLRWGVSRRNSKPAALMYSELRREKPAKTHSTSEGMRRATSMARVTSAKLNVSGAKRSRDVFLRMATALPVAPSGMISSPSESEGCQAPESLDISYCTPCATGGEVSTSILTRMPFLR